MEKFTQPTNQNNNNRPTKKPSTKKVLLVCTGVLAIALTGVITWNLVAQDKTVDKGTQQPTETQAVDAEKPEFQDKSKIENYELGDSLADDLKPGERSVSAQTPYKPVIVHRREAGKKIDFINNELDINANSDNPKKDLVITYTSDYDKVTGRFLEDQEEVQGWEYDLPETPEKTLIEINLIGQYEGYAAYKDKDGSWQRIKSVKSRPDVEAKYTDKGGRSAEEVEKANAKAEAAYNNLLDKAVEKMKGDTELDFSSAPELEEMTGGAEAKEGLQTLNKLILEQADKIRKPYTLYTRISWSQTLSQEGYEAIGEQDAFNYYDTEYGTLLPQQTVDTLNQAYQTEVEALANTEGATILTQLGFIPDREHIVINGVTYHKDDLILDLYHPNTESEWVTDADGTNILEGILYEAFTDKGNIQLHLE